MAARRSSTFTDEDRRKLIDRVVDLENRMRSIEARVRREAAESRARGRIELSRPAGKVVRPPAPRPRCPSCTHEIPKGKKRDECLWCGFRFDALGLFSKRR